MNPLYQQVSSQILSQIQSGKLKVGDRLPPEACVATEMGVSRSTVRLAFAELENAGVLLRRKRTGTQIIAEKPQQRFNMATSGIQELLSLGRDTEFVISETRNVRAEEIAQLKGHDSETGYWLEVSGTRILVDEVVPFSVNRVYVPARYSGIEPLLHNGVTSVFQAIEKTFDVAVARVTQTTRACACPKEEARIMGIKKATPVMRIDAALYERNGGLMEISVATFDPERFQINTDVEIE